jgi:hypothetical protein
LTLVKLIWMRVDDLQRRTGVRWTLTALVSLLLLAAFGWLFVTGSSLQRDRRAIVITLAGANLTRGDAAAVDFVNTGTVEVEGRIFGGPAFADRARTLYDAEGNLRNPFGAAQLLLRDRTPAFVPPFLLDQSDTVVLIGAAAIAAAVLAIWTALFPHLLLTLIGATLLVIPFILRGELAWAIAVVTAVALCFAFVLLASGAALALGRASPTFAIASTVLREAMRLRIAVFFVGLLLVALPLIPLWISAGEPLRYQVQSYLSRSVGLLFVLAAIMTVFLSCATVAFEIRDRQIWQLMTKPVARVQYLIGKWLGIVTLNVILVMIGGLAIFVQVRSISTRTAQDAADAQAVVEQVLVARQGSYPAFDRLTSEELREVVERRITSDPILMSEIEDGTKSETEVKRELIRTVISEHAASQRTIPAGQERTFEFPGLARARDLGAPVTLRFSFDIGRIDPHEVHPVMFKFANGIYSQRNFVPAQPHVMTIQPEDVMRVVGEDGVLRLTIENAGYMETESGMERVPGIGPMIFKADALEALYRVDSFESNFIRALLVQLIKLSFLAMLGVCAATILSFSVATLLSFTVLTIGSLTPFLGMSIDEYGIRKDTPALWQAVQTGVKGIASASERVLRAFGEISPTQQLVEGRLISWESVISAFLVLGLVWSGGVFIAGFAAFRRKELAVYSGNT